MITSGIEHSPQRALVAGDVRALVVSREAESLAGSPLGSDPGHATVDIDRAQAALSPKLSPELMGRILSR